MFLELSPFGRQRSHDEHDGHRTAADGRFARDLEGDARFGSWIPLGLVTLAV